MQEEGKVGPEELVAEGSHGFSFPIHSKPAEDEQSFQLSRANVAEHNILDRSEDDNRNSKMLGDEQGPVNFAMDKMLQRFTRRLARLKPVLAASVGTKLEKIRSNFELRIGNEVSPLEFLLYSFGDFLDTDAERMINRSTLKIANEIERGVRIDSRWEREVEETELRMKQARGRNELSVALLNRHQIKELAKAKEVEAYEFSLRMQEVAKEKALKRQADFQAREFVLMVEARKIEELEQKQKVQKVSKQHQKAMESLKNLQERKKVRQIDFLQGLNRQKKVAAMEPFYVQKDNEFKEMEDNRYYSRGRHQNEVEKFMKQKKTYHLLRNKMNLDDLLNPKRIMSSEVTNSQFTPSRLVSAHQMFVSIKSQTKGLNNPADILDFDQSNIKFAKLPKLKFKN